MRSRNGNRSFILTYLTVITTLTFGADNYYYIGYRLTAKNTQAINETLTVSKAMQPCLSFHPSSAITLSRINQESLQTLLQREQSLFLEFTASNELRIKSNDTFTVTHPQTLSSLTLPTRCYAVEFNDESVTITATK
ncbi:hypothetical protein [Sulfuricurvum sp.]|uniref:hypothetical protein n=1 Tax=Sulfuricurvum sp. TaxID=2025608 RepID=UPI003BB503BE